jgi:copper chaperone CopZ
MAITFAVKDIHCEACAKRVRKAVESVVPGARIEVDIANGRVSVEPASAPDKIAAALTNSGYPAEVAR